YSMAEYTLQCFAQSGNAYKVALMLNLCEVDWAPQWIDFFNGATRAEDFREHFNAMGEAPVLEHKGQVFSQSGVMLEYLAQQTGRFGAETDAERWEILRWILWDNHKLTSYLASLRFLMQFTTTGDPAVMAWLRGRMTANLGILNLHLAQRD